MDERKIKILFVDDEEQLRSLVQQILESENYDVIVAEDGEEGLRKFRSEDPDILFTDIDMPGMNGIQLICMIRHSKPHFPCIAYSGKSGTVARYEEQLDILKVRLLTKPIQLHELLEGVAETVRKIGN